MSPIAKIVEDSYAVSTGVRLTTLELEYPRWILAELNTHRMLSRSTASSRAIPIEKVLEQVKNNPAMPIRWGKNKPGMQATEELSGAERDAARQEWLKARDSAVTHVEALSLLGLHKQVANRLLEPFVFARTVVTATDWENFFNLRLHPDAQPEMQALAKAMRNVMELSKPKPVQNDGWHLPYVTEDERRQYQWSQCVKLSVARCARVSYNRHGSGKADVAADIALHDRLLKSGHMSPFEHMARPLNNMAEYVGNYRAWRQYRKEVPNEDVYKPNP